MSEINNIYIIQLCFAFACEFSGFKVSLTLLSFRYSLYLIRFVPLVNIAQGFCNNLSGISESLSLR